MRNAILLGLLFALTGCPGSDGGGSKSQGEAPACTTSSTYDIAVGEKHLRNFEVRDNQIFGDWTSDAYACFIPNGANEAALPEIAVVVGNQNGLQSFTPVIKKIVRFVSMAAVASNRRGCIYVLSRQNLAVLAGRTNLQRLMFFGHGGDGNLVDPFTNEMIRPTEISQFQSPWLKEVHFFSCQAGQKKSQWENVFALTHPNLEMSSDNIAVVSALSRMVDILGDVGDCKL